MEAMYLSSGSRRVSEWTALHLQAEAGRRHPPLPISIPALLLHRPCVIHIILHYFMHNSPAFGEEDPLLGSGLGAPRHGRQEVEGLVPRTKGLLPSTKLGNNSKINKQTCQLPLPSPTLALGLS